MVSPAGGVETKHGMPMHVGKPEFSAIPPGPLSEAQALGENLALENDCHRDSSSLGASFRGLQGGCGPQHSMEPHPSGASNPGPPGVPGDNNFFPDWPFGTATWLFTENISVILAPPKMEVFMKTLNTMLKALSIAMFALLVGACSQESKDNAADAASDAATSAQEAADAAAEASRSAAEAAAEATESTMDATAEAADAAADVAADAAETAEEAADTAADAVGESVDSAADAAADAAESAADAAESAADAAGDAADAAVESADEATSN